MKNIIFILIMLGLYGGALVLKNNQIEEKKNTYIPTTYDIQKKSGIPVTTAKVVKDKFQNFVTVSGTIKGNMMTSSVAPFVRRQLSAGKPAKLDLNHGSKPVWGTVTSVSSSPSLLTGLYEVRVYFKQTLPKHLEHVTVDIPVEEVKNVLLVPREAVSNREQEPLVYVLKDQKISKRYLKIAGANPDVYWIRSGLQEGETIITSDTRYFSGGEFVQIVGDTRKEL